MDFSSVEYFIFISSKKPKVFVNNVIQMLPLRSGSKKSWFLKTNPKHQIFLISTLIWGFWIEYMLPIKYTIWKLHCILRGNTLEHPEMRQQNSTLILLIKQCVFIVANGMSLCVLNHYLNQTTLFKIISMVSVKAHRVPS